MRCSCMTPPALPLSDPPRAAPSQHFCRHHLAATVTSDSRGRTKTFRSDPVRALREAFPRLHRHLVAAAQASAVAGASSASASIGRGGAGGPAASGGDSVILPSGTPTVGSGVVSGSGVLKTGFTPWRSVDTDVSGCTANAVMVVGGNLLCGNVGDSRSILVSRAQRGAAPAAGGGSANPHLGTVRVAALSKDHKPGRAEERARISRTDAQIISESMLLPHGDPDKLYVCRKVGSSIKYGVLFSRSIGDLDSHTHLGLTAEAEVRTHTLQPDSDQFVVLATDGVWDFMSNKDVARVTARSLAASWQAARAEAQGGGRGGTPTYRLHADAQRAAEDVVASATRKWDRAAMGRQDDITVQVLAFTWMSPAEAEADAAAWSAWYRSRTAPQPQAGGAGGGGAPVPTPGGLPSAPSAESVGEVDITLDVGSPGGYASGDEASGEEDSGEQGAAGGGLEDAGARPPHLAPAPATVDSPKASAASTDPASEYATATGSADGEYGVDEFGFRHDHGYDE